MTGCDGVMQALRDVLPYAESRLEDMAEAAQGHDCAHYKQALRIFNRAASIANYPTCVTAIDTDGDIICEGCKS